MSIRGAIFDADGTLLDSMSIWRDAGARYLKTLGFTAEEGLGDILYPMTLEEGSAYLKDRYALPQTEREIRAGVVGVISGFYRHEVRGKPGVKEFLAALSEKGVLMTIATTGDRELLEAALERIGILPYFKKIFTCSELKTTKKSPYIYKAAAEYMKTPVKSTVVFEDALHAVKSAREAGFNVVAVSDTESAIYRDEITKIADLYMDGFSDLEKFWAYAAQV